MTVRYVLTKFRNKEFKSALGIEVCIETMRNVKSDWQRVVFSDETRIDHLFGDESE